MMVGPACPWPGHIVDRQWGNGCPACGSADTERLVVTTTNYDEKGDVLQVSRAPVYRCRTRGARVRSTSIGSRW